MSSNEYLMESSDEALRLDIKTDPEAVRKQAKICGMCPGARVLDGGCGSGKTTSILQEIVQPGGSVIGIDFSQDRINFAKNHYADNENIEFRCMDIRQPLHELGQFDAVWIRFVLEYYLEGSQDILRNALSVLKPGGKLCLLDLDNNCLSHWPVTVEQDEILKNIMDKISYEFNFDPYVGKKLYTYLYDLGLENIDVNVIPHHLIYGELRSNDAFNWLKKVEMATFKIRGIFKDYQGGHERFFDDFRAFFNDPKRFTYTPLIICCGIKPADI